MLQTGRAMVLFGLLAFIPVAIAVLPAPLGFWPFNETTGLADVSGNGNDAVIVIDQPLIFSQGPDGRDKCSLLLGTSSASYLEVQGPELKLGATSWTIILFGKANLEETGATNAPLIIYQPSIPDAKDGIYMRIYEHSFVTYPTTSSIDTEFLTGSPEINTTSWQLYAFAYDANSKNYTQMVGNFTKIIHSSAIADTNSGNFLVGKRSFYL